MVVDVVRAVVIGEAENGPRQTLAELIPTPSLEVLSLMSVKDSKRWDFASSATRRGTVASNARSLRERHQPTLPTDKNDGGKAALRTYKS
jgi:hypothetical protein